MNLRYIKCKTALSNSNLPGLDYSLNPYVGCKHSCAYCYAPNILRINRQEWYNIIGIKNNIPLVLSKELKRKNEGVIGLSTVTDPYEPIEKKFCLTKYCLEQLINYDYPIHIQTKSYIINRDIKLIAKLTKPEIMISISSTNDCERRILEPYTSSINDRLKTLKNFSNIGIKTSVFLGPIYPTITKDDLLKIIHIFIDYNVKEIMLDILHLKKGIWENISRILRNYPKLKKQISKERFIDNNLLENIYEIIINETKNYNIKISKAFQ